MNPNNPTGVILDHAYLLEIVEFCRINNILIFSDEIYHGINFEKKCHSLLEFTAESFVINSFSKFFRMPGWRLGWAVVPPEDVVAFNRLAQNFNISPPAPSQIGALESLNHIKEYKEIITDYRASRDLLLACIKELGFTNIASPDGAFYIYAQLDKDWHDSKEFCENLLRDGNIAATSGVDFDPENGHRFIRLSYAQSTDHIKGAILALKTYFLQYHNSL